jgi:Domain of unknown function (DUF1996)/Domain of unknown function (DUF4124)
MILTGKNIMLNLVSANKKVGLAVATAVLALMSLDSSAQIYKWRDQRGVTQYSDKPPATSVVAGFVQATRNEVVNALQKKDVCTLDTPAKKSLPTQQLAANFFGFGPTSNVLNNQASNNGLSGLSGMGKLAIGALSKPKPVVAQYSPFSNAASSVYRAGRNNVTVFGAPNNPFQNKLAASAGPKSVPSGGTLVAANTPVAVPKPTPTVNLTPPSNAPVITPKPTQTANPNPATVVANATPPSPKVLPADAPKPSTNIVQVDQMPAVNISKTPFGDAGYADVRIKNGQHDGVHLGDLGAFRIGCTLSHMGNNDPIVYPNQKGAAHHHTFFGNTLTDFSSTTESILGSGNTTCDGGIANRTAYWIPSLIDTSSDAPLKPSRIIVYYKEGFNNGKIVVPPKGLRMIVGNSKAKNETDAKGTFVCAQMPNEVWQTASKSIPVCGKNSFVRFKISFPNCWDGINLDSPDHISHMAYSANDFQRADGSWYKTPNNCPSSHPVAVPVVTINADYYATTDAGTANWRLASDNYTKQSPGGYSFHADWMNGWDETILQKVVTNCLNKHIDCGVNYLGEGHTFY